MGRYFQKFPSIMYNDQVAKNITARAQFSNSTRLNKTIFYPYTLKEQDQRLDVVAHKYYKDSDLTWLIMMANQAIDPYYDLGVPQDQLEEFIKAKYGSTEIAMATIMYWRNDWISDDSLISEASYASLQTGLRKYWNAAIDQDNNIIGYERKKEDWIANTNKIVEVPVVSVLEVGDLYTVGENEGYVVGNTGTSITLQHVTGEFDDEITIATVIPENEQPYWTTVTAYVMETESNQDKRQIKLLDNKLTQKIEKEIERLLR